MVELICGLFLEQNAPILAPSVCTYLRWAGELIDGLDDKALLIPLFEKSRKITLSVVI